MKKIGDVNQCRCGEGYYETALTIKHGHCEPCIEYFERRERQFKADYAMYGCPFCTNSFCTIAATGKCSDWFKTKVAPFGLKKIILGWL